MYKYELVTLLEKVLYKGYQMKNGEHAFHCPFCNHHKKKLQVNCETQKWHCWVCNKGGQTYLRASNKSSKTSICPERGRLILFDGMKYEHGATPNRIFNRYTIAGWWRKEKA